MHTNKSPVWETPPFDSGRLKTTERVYLDTLSSKIVNQMSGQNTTMISTIETPHTLITGPPGLVKVNKEGVSMALLQNCGPFRIWIERDTEIGFAEEINELDNMEKMDYKLKMQ